MLIDMRGDLVLVLLGGEIRERLLPLALRCLAAATHPFSNRFRAKREYGLGQNMSSTVLYWPEYGLDSLIRQGRNIALTVLYVPCTRAPARARPLLPAATDLSHRMYRLISFRTSTPPKNCQLIDYYYYSTY